MTTINASATVTEIESRENTDFEFVFEGRLFQLELSKSLYNELPYSIRNQYGEFEDFKTCINVDFAEISENLFDYWSDITENSDKGLAMLRKQARKQLLSFVVSSANKLRSALKSMSLAMHTAWTKAKILATGFVQFVKMSDVDIEGEIPVQSRRVASLESFGVERKTANKTAGLLRFIDLDKIAKGLSAAESVISFHVWQVVGWSVNKSIG